MYEFWHNNKKYSHIHWAVFIAIALFVTHALIEQINQGVISAEAQTAKSLIQPSDLTFLGAFAGPSTVNGQTTTSGAEGGIAYRNVNGEKRLLVTAGGKLYEIRVPSDSQLSTTNPSTVAQLVKDWGSTSALLGGGVWGQSRGITFDSATNRVYRVAGDYYNVPPGGDSKYPTLWSFRLNDATGLMDNPEGPWGTTKHPFKQTMSGVLMIPQWFANTYLGGKTLALGMGGGYSTLTNGPASMGPSLTAVSKPEGTPAMSHLSDTPLVGYPFSQGASWGTPDRARRDPNYDVTPNQIPSTLQPNGGWLDGGKWDVQNGLGAWTSNDMIGANGIWIDTSNKHGVLFSAVNTIGDMFYYSSDVHWEDLQHSWYMYDPMDLVSVANGTKLEYQIQAAWRTPIQYPFINYPINANKANINHADPADPDWGDGLPFNANIRGITFDPVENRLYVHRPPFNSTPAYPSPVFLVYQLNGGGSPVPTPTPMPTPTPTLTPTPTPTNRPPIGQLDSVDCSFITGWTFDQDTPTTAITTEIYRDGAKGTGVLIASGSTNVLRSTVNSTYGITGNHGFNYATPASLKDGNTHSVYAYGINSNSSGQNTLLSGSPVNLFCATSTPTPTPIPTLTPTPLPTSTLTPSPTIIPSPTAIFTNTPSPTTTITMSPMPTLSSSPTPGAQSIPTPPPGIDITIQDLLSYSETMGGFLMILGGILAGLAVIVSGVMYLVSGGSSQGIATAKNMLKAGIVGALVVFGAGLIINSVRGLAENPLKFFQ